MKFKYLCVSTTGYITYSKMKTLFIEYHIKFADKLQQYATKSESYERHFRLTVK